MNYALLGLVVAVTAGIAFMLVFLVALLRDQERTIGYRAIYTTQKGRTSPRSLTSTHGHEAERAESSDEKWVAIIAICMCASLLSQPPGAAAGHSKVELAGNLVRRA